MSAFDPSTATLAPEDKASPDPTASRPEENPAYIGAGSVLSPSKQKAFDPSTARIAPQFDPSTAVTPEEHVQRLIAQPHFNPAQYALSTGDRETGFAARQAPQNRTFDQKAGAFGSTLLQPETYGNALKGVAKFGLGLAAAPLHTLAQGAATVAAPIAGALGYDDAQRNLENETQTQGAEATLAGQRIEEGLRGIGRGVRDVANDVTGANAALSPEDRDQIERQHFDDEIQAAKNARQLSESRPLNTGVVAGAARLATGTQDLGDVYSPEALQAQGAQPVSPLLTESMAAAADPTNLAIPLAGEIPGVRQAAGGLVQAAGKVIQIPDRILGAIPKFSHAATPAGIYGAVAHPGAVLPAAGAYGLGKTLGWLGRALDEKGAAMRTGIPSASDAAAQSAASAGTSALGANANRFVGNTAGNVVATALGFAPINYFMSGGDPEKFAQSEVGAGVMGGLFGMAGDRQRLQDVAQYRLARYGEQQFTDNPLFQNHQETMAKFDPADQERINVLRGTLNGGTGTDVLVLDGPTFAQKVGLIGGDARGQFAKDPSGNTIYLNADAIGKTSAENAAGVTDTAGHETGHAVVDFLRNAGREADAQGLFSSLAQAMTPEQLQALTDDYHGKLLASTDTTGKTPEEIEAIKQQISANNPPEKIAEENLAEITRKILKGQPMATYALPQPLKERIMDAAQGWLEQRGWSPKIDPSADLSFKAQMVREAGRRMNAILYDVGKTAAGAMDKGPTAMQELMKARNELQESPKITPRTPAIQAAAIQRMRDAAQKQIAELERQLGISQEPPPAPPPSVSIHQTAARARAAAREAIVGIQNLFGGTQASAQAAIDAVNAENGTPFTTTEDLLRAVLARSARIRAQQQPTATPNPSPSPSTNMTPGAESQIQPATAAAVDQAQPATQAIAPLGVNTAAEVGNAFSGMAKGATAALYDMLFGKLQKGDLTEAGRPSNILQKAKPIFDSGFIKSPEDLKDFVQGDPRFNQSTPQPATANATQTQTVPSVTGAANQARPGDGTVQSGAGTAAPNTAEVLRRVAKEAGDKAVTDLKEAKPKTQQKALDAARDKAALAAMAKTHAEANPDTDLVTWRENKFGGTSISGQKIDTSDPFHEELLKRAGLSGTDIGKLAEIQSKLGQPIGIEYLSAPESPGAKAAFDEALKNKQTAQLRKRAQDEFTASGRVAGDTSIRRVPKSYIPQGITFNGPSGTFEVNGFSPDKFLANAEKVLPWLQKKGIETYSGVNDPKLLADLSGYAENHANGYLGNGSRPIEGTALTPTRQNLDRAPYVIPKDRFDVLNAILGDESGRLVNDAGEPKKGTVEQKASRAEKQALAGKNSPFLNPETGEVNRIRELMGKEGDFSFKTEKGEENKGSKVLESAWETLRPELIDKIGDPNIRNEQTLRPSSFTGDLSQIRGVPRSLYAASGFMPRDFAEDETGRMAPESYSESDANRIMVLADTLAEGGDTHIQDVANAARQAAYWRTVEPKSPVQALAVGRVRDRETNALSELSELVARRRGAMKALGMESELDKPMGGLVFDDDGKQVYKQFPTGHDWMQWVREHNPVTQGSFMPNDTMKDDMTNQSAWMNSEAKRRGYSSVDELHEADPAAMTKMAAQWRIYHPRDEQGTLLQNDRSRAINNTLYDDQKSDDSRPLAGSRSSLGDALSFVRGNAPASTEGPWDRAKESVAIAQNDVLRKWAESQGLIANIPHLGEDFGGNEHHAFPADGRWIKSTRGTATGVGMGSYPMVKPDGSWELTMGTPEQYLESRKLQNEVFGDDIRIHGIQSGGKHVNVITSQPDVAGETPDQRDIDSAMQSSGFSRMDEGTYYRRADNVAVFDLRPANAFVTKDGALLPIDAILVHPSEDLLEALKDSRIHLLNRGTDRR